MAVRARDRLGVEADGHAPPSCGYQRVQIVPLAAGATFNSDTEANGRERSWTLSSLGAELREGKGASCGIAEPQAEQQGKPKASVHD